MSDFIKVDNVSFSYDGNRVLDNISLSVKEGEFVALLGRNGCGKSTMAKLFNVLLTPDEGTITIDGITPKTEDDVYEVRSRVGLVLQNPDNQLVTTIVEEDVAFGPENLGIPTEEIRKRVDSALKAVDMYEYRTHASHKLSGGQKQRIAIAGIIAMQPKCIVLDEPTAMLDPKGRQEVMDTIKFLNKEHNITIVLITHYMDEAVQADRVIVMDNGNVLTQGTPQQVFSEVELLKKHSLDVPQSIELMYLLKKRGIDVESLPLTPDICVEMLKSKL
ncbi:MAG: energy-coupling factor transporter ATPase [Acutalibacteraceae bacterium]|nr:energy-coupling factor transporter ATPase [Acutalibacteraceae bacterium]